MVARPVVLFIGQHSKRVGQWTAPKTPLNPLTRAVCSLRAYARTRARATCQVLRLMRNNIPFPLYLIFPKSDRAGKETITEP